MSTKHYEIIFIVSSKVEERKIEKVIEKVKNLIVSEGGEIISQTNIGRKKFAYPIEHQKHGYYQVYEFDLSSEKLKKINHELKLNKAEILRFLIINKKIMTTDEALALEKKQEIPEKIITTPRDKKEKVTRKKISLDDLDKKLDEILEKEIIQ